MLIVTTITTTKKESALFVTSKQYKKRSQNCIKSYLCKKVHYVNMFH